MFSSTSTATDDDSSDTEDLTIKSEGMDLLPRTYPAALRAGMKGSELDQEGGIIQIKNGVPFSKNYGTDAGTLSDAEWGAENTEERKGIKGMNGLKGMNGIKGIGKGITVGLIADIEIDNQAEYDISFPSLSSTESFSTSSNRFSTNCSSSSSVGGVFSPGRYELGIAGSRSVDT